jgi:ubiquitin carboxyl-terminal hydrolase 9/24
MVPTYRYSLLQTWDELTLNANNTLHIDDNVFHKLQRMFSYLDLSLRKYYIPDGFCYAFKDINGNPTNVFIQDDAYEFF